MKKTTITIVMATLCLIFSAKAQIPKTALPKNQAIIGRVISASTGEPLPGAVIKITSNNQTILSNDKGEFILSLLNGNYNLSVYYLSYKAKTLSIQIPMADSLIIKLEVDNTNLNEVEINAGYYTVKDKERTGSISRITSETIAKQPVANPLQALQGRMPGVYIQQSSGIPGSNINVQIRGRNSIDAGNNPFYIIDGVPFSSTSLSSIYSPNPFRGTGSSPFNTISPDDIETVEVLKDADATAIYGSRGANGVILITTKKGKAGKTQFTANVSGGISRVGKTFEMMNTEQYLQMRTEAFANDNAQPGPTDYDINGTWSKARYTNWQKELIGNTAKFSKGQLSLSGGNSNTQVLMSGNFLHQTTVFPGDHNYKRIAAHISVNHSAMDNRFKANFSAMYSGDKNNMFNGDLTARSFILSPNAPALHQPDGKLNWENSTWINPLREMEMDYNVTNNTLVSNLMLSYKLLPDLSFRASIGFNDNRLRDISTLPSSFYDPAEQKTAAQAQASHNNAVFTSWIAEPQIDWNKDTGFGKISVLAGMTFQSQDKDQLVIYGEGFASDAQISNIKSATRISISDYQNSAYRYQAVYGRINYNLEGKYILNLTGRRDGSSRFKPGNRFADFGAIGAAWLFSEAKFVQKNLPFLSIGKLRTSYGITGNDQIGDYEYLDVYNAVLPYNGVVGLNPTRLYNPDFAWEINRKLELGLELGFLNNRFTLNLNYFRNRSGNQLVQYPLALTTGFSGIRSNMNAKVQITGLEIELNSVNVKQKDFSWNSSFNITFSGNKLLSFPGLAGSSYASKYVVGHSLSISKRYKFTGVNPETGLWTFKDENGDNKINAANDRTTLKQTGQRFYGGFNNDFVYKQLKLSFLLQFVKQEMSDFTSAISSAPGRTNHSTLILNNRWKEKGDEATIQRLAISVNPAARTAYDLYSLSDAAIKDASYVRLKNIDLSYGFKKPVAGSLVRLYMQGQNLFTLTSYVGLDPENGGFALPPLKTLTAGIQFTF